MSIDQELHHHIKDFLKRIEPAAKDSAASMMRGGGGNVLEFKISFKLKPHEVFPDGIQEKMQLYYSVSVEEECPELIYEQYVSDEEKLKSILK